MLIFRRYEGDEWRMCTEQGNVLVGPGEGMPKPAHKDSFLSYCLVILSLGQCADWFQTWVPTKGKRAFKRMLPWYSGTWGHSSLIDRHCIVLKMSTCLTKGLYLFLIWREGDWWRYNVNTKFSRAVVAYTFKPRIWDTEADRSLWVQGQSGLQELVPGQLGLLHREPRNPSTPKHLLPVNSVDW